MLVSEAIQYLNTFTFTSSSLNDDERIDALLKSLNLAHYEIYKRYWHIPDFETITEIYWDNIDTPVFSLNRDGILKLRNVYNDTIENIEKNLFNPQYLHDKKNDFYMHAGRTYLSSKPFLETYQTEEGLEAQRYTCTAIIIPEPKELALEDEGDIKKTAVIPYQNVFFDALLAKALLYHHSTLDGTNPKFREWQQAYNEKIRYLDGYYTSSKK